MLHFMLHNSFSITYSFPKINRKLSWKPLIPKKTITGDFSTFENLFYDTIAICNYAPSQSCVLFTCNGNKISLFATMYNGISDTTNKKTLAIYFR